MRRMKSFRHLLMLGVCILASGCNDNHLPEYWVCTGRTIQQASLNTTGEVREYSGHETMLIERLGNMVTQYTSKPFTGVFQTCEDSPETLQFQLGECGRERNQDQKWNRSAVLNKKSGELLWTESRVLDQMLIKGAGKFSCAYYHHRYPARVFY